MVPPSVDLKPLHAVLPEGIPEVLQEAAEFFFAELVGFEGQKLSADDCAEIALRQVLTLSDNFGGTYLPKGVVFRLTPRNRQMCEEFRGDYKVLARKYQLCEQQVRNIVGRWQREKFLARQGTINFDEVPHE